MPFKNSSIHELKQDSNQIGAEIRGDRPGKHEVGWDQTMIERLAKEREELVKTKKNMIEGALEIDQITGNTNEIPPLNAIGNKSEQQLTDVKKGRLQFDL